MVVAAFELIFEIEALGEEREFALLDAYDCFLGGHGRVVLLTITWEGRDATEAALGAVGELRRHGVVIRRFVEDLVTRRAIAERSGKTTQAVGLWARGERQVADPFPAPYVLAGGGLWLWGEVNEWLRRQGHAHDDGIAYPTRADHARVNGVLQGFHDLGAYLPPNAARARAVASRTKSPFAAV